jgi:hypothetical protein
MPLYTLIFLLLIAGSVKRLYAGPDAPLPPPVGNEEPASEPNIIEIPVPLPSESGEEEAELTGYDRYRIIAQQNIFSRQRTAPRRRSANASEEEIEVIKPVVVSLYILRGTACQGDRKIAFVEDVIAGNSIRAQVGSTILAGTIKDIRVNDVVFEENGQTRDVKIGDTFGKLESTVGSVGNAQTARPAPAAEPNQPATPKNQDELLKQMIERRNRELNR